MKILVTGSLGTLGTPLCKELRKRGHVVRGIDLFHSPEADYERCDISEHRQLQRVYRTFRPDVTYHFAAEFGRINGQEYPEQLWKTNCLGTSNIIRTCMEYGARLVFASSSEVYGESDDPMREDSLLRPTLLNEYAISKLAGEHQVEAAQLRGLKAKILRFFNAYGPGEFYTPYRSVVCLFCYSALVGKTVNLFKGYHRVFMYVDDWCRTVANVAERFDDLTHHIYNIAGVEYRSMEELADIVRRHASQLTVREIPVDLHNTKNKKPRIDWAVEDLDHHLTVNLEKGIVLTLGWMRSIYDSEGSLRNLPERPEARLADTLANII